MMKRPTAARLARATTATALVAMVFSATPAAHAANSGPAQAVIVEADTVVDATIAVNAVGGTVDSALPIVDGVAAHVGPAGIAALQANPRLQVMADMTLHPTGAALGGSHASAPAIDPQI